MEPSYYERNKERLLQYQKAYNLEKRTTILEYHRQYFQTNKLKLSAKQKLYNQLHRIKKPPKPKVKTIRPPPPLPVFEPEPEPEPNVIYITEPIVVSFW